MIAYITISVRTPIEADTYDETKAKAEIKAEELIRSIPDSMIEDIEVQNGLITTSIYGKL
jgi:hypothetical protein